MGLSSALNTSLNGLRLNETKIDVLGNNIANADTTGFKASNVQFQTQLFRTLSVGAAPSNVSGGTNPRQIGLGASIASITKDFTQGAVTNTTSPSDLAIQGDGFFIVNSPEGDSYTRAGQFRLNNQNELVDPQGFRVQGFAANEDFSGVINTETTGLEIPVGEFIELVRPTSEVSITGALLPYAKDDIPVQPSIVSLSGVDALSAPLGFTTGGGVGIANAASALTAIESNSTTFLAANDTITFTPRTGGQTLEDTTFTINASGDPNTGTTVGDFLTFIADSYGIPDTDVSIDATGVIIVEGLSGASNDFNLAPSDFSINGGTGFPGLSQKTQTASGESASTDFVVFDSLGERLNVQVSIALDPGNTTPGVISQFDVRIESDDTTGPDRLLYDGVLQFDGEGQLTAGSPRNVTIERGETAANDLTFSIDFSRLFGVSDETSSQSSTISLRQQDGAAPGTLTTFAIDDSGVINGILDNGQVLTLGQLTLARFRNPDGLVEVGGNRYAVGTASGEPVVVTPGDFGAGQILSGAIELSNTDIGRSLVDLIVASTNYRGNARVINSVQELVDELLVLGR